MDEFLEKCAIDNNVVISFDYFGDEPRKDLLHNATLCTTWDPCKLSYLYRLEVILIYYAIIIYTYKTLPIKKTTAYHHFLIYFKY